MSSMQCFASSAGSLVLRYRAGMITSVSTSSPYFQALPLCSMRYAPFRGFLAASITAVGCEFGTAGFPFGCTASEGDSVRGSPSRDTLWLRFTSLRPPPAAASPHCPAACAFRLGCAFIGSHSLFTPDDARGSENPTGRLQTESSSSEASAERLARKRRCFRRRQLAEAGIPRHVERNA